MPDTGQRIEKSYPRIRSLSGFRFPLSALVSATGDLPQPLDAKI
jgi:hypothetical protein